MPGGEHETGPHTGRLAHRLGSEPLTSRLVFAAGSRTGSVAGAMLTLGRQSPRWRSIRGGPRRRDPQVLRRRGA
jgi:hypothetical protein